MDTQQVLQTILPIAQQAGEIVRQRYHNAHEAQLKASSIDIATEADRASEAYIVDALLKHFPEHHLVGEEGGGSGAPIQQADYLWFIDPIDGTTNYANQIPHFCISIAMTDNQRVPLVGVIYDPTRDETYSATQGGGAQLNGEALHVSSKTDLLQCVLASGFSYDRRSNPDNNIAQWGAMILQARGVRRMGSAALDLAYVAAGRLDGYWERALHPWDVMAGVLLVQEAGGTVTDYQGGTQPQWGDDGRYVASNGHIHAEMLRVLQQSYSS